MEKIKIERINFLAAKAKTKGLTEQEKREQKELRQEYIDSVKANMRASLNNVYLQDESGNKTKLSKKGVKGNH
ncbi:MAG: DUF896 domain-containing protein [Bacillota bacterium]|jgi:uncharacterized protein YnzC (UPF0291/DUF896 family)